MRIAVICVGHTGDPTGIALLAQYFAAINGDLYVHIDKKADITPYNDLPIKFSNVHLLQDRLPYFWGGFNGVRVVINALTVASARYDYDRYFYITEDTAPLLRTNALLELLAEDVEYFGIYRTEWIRRRYTGFFYYDCTQINPRLYTEEDKEVTEEFLNGIERLTALRKRGKCPLPDIFYGYAYFALTAKAVAELIQVYHENTHLRESFEFSGISEEQYFPTILGTSKSRYVFRPFIHMDFTRYPQPFVYETVKEVRALQSGQHIFARKVIPAKRGIAQFIRDLIDPPSAG